MSREAVSNLGVFAVDVGSVRKGRLAWASGDRVGHELDDLVAAVAIRLERGEPVALGFECPLSIPIPAMPIALGRGRTGEPRAWSSTPAASALATGLAQVVWVLRELRVAVPAAAGFLAFEEFIAADGARLLLWEACVTGEDKGASDAEDAQIAVRAFVTSLPTPPASITSHHEQLSLAGAALLWAGWTSEVRILRAQPLAIRAQRPTRSER